MARAFKSAVKKTIKQLTVNTKNGDLRCINIAEICYVESQNHNINIHTNYGLIIVKSTIAVLLEQLDELSVGQFISPYKGYIVNQSKILWVAKDCINIIGAVQIPISRRNYKTLQKQFATQFFGFMQEKLNTKM